MADSGVLEHILIFGIIFWLLLPVPAMFLEIKTVQEMDKCLFSDCKNDTFTKPSILDTLFRFLDLLWQYFKFLFLTWSDIPQWLSLLLFMLKMLNLLGLLVLLKP